MMSNLIHLKPTSFVPKSRNLKFNPILKPSAFGGVGSNLGGLGAVRSCRSMQIVSWSCFCSHVARIFGFQSITILPWGPFVLRVCTRFATLGCYRLSAFGFFVGRVLTLNPYVNRSFKPFFAVNLVPYVLKTVKA